MVAFSKVSLKDVDDLPFSASRLRRAEHEQALENIQYTEYT